MNKYYFITFLVVISLSQLIAQNNNLAVFENMRSKNLYVEGFQLNETQTVKIDIVGIHHRDRREEVILGTGWIIDATTREMVWRMEPQRLRGRQPQAEEQSATLELSPGSYEVYYTTYPYLDWDHYWHRHRGKHSDGIFSGLFDWLFDRDDDWDEYRYDRELYKDFRMTVKGKGQQIDRRKVLENIEKLKQQAVISLDAMDDDLYLNQGFELKEPLKLSIRILAEARDDGNFDYGWIIDTRTRKRVWEFSLDDSEDAGGAYKNRLIVEMVSLSAGKYAAIYITDDSHSPKKWNATPPYDPYLWGMTIRLDNQSKANKLVKFDYENLYQKNKFLSLTPARDDDFYSKGFTLKKDTQLHLYALGEGRRGDMYDYGWIVAAKTRKRAWEMDYDETVHAGGSHKNRLFDGNITLPAGNYIAYFVTDGSHAYNDWNASPPYDPRNWGLTLSGADDDFSADQVSEYEETEDPNIMTQLIRMRDDDREYSEFALKKDSEVRIYALGEGVRGDMYDYGWIEEAETGKVVWEMTYRKTDHAGGAKKNRVFNDTILLKKGQYRLYYETDDSHSYNDWNSAPPHDLMMWGITIYKVD